MTGNPAGGRSFGRMLGDGMENAWGRVTSIPNNARDNWMLWGLGLLGAGFALFSGMGLLGMIAMALIVPLVVSAVGGFGEGMFGRRLLPQQFGQAGGAGGQAPDTVAYVPPVPVRGATRAAARGAAAEGAPDTVAYTPPGQVGLNPAEARRLAAGVEPRGLAVASVEGGVRVPPTSPPNPTMQPPQAGLSGGNN